MVLDDLWVENEKNSNLTIFYSNLLFERGLFKRGLVSFFPKIWDFSKTTEGIQNRFGVEIETRFRVVFR